MPPRNLNVQDGYRICSLCKQEFPETSEYFGKQRIIKGAYYWRTECLNCRRKQKNESNARHRDTINKWHAKNAERVNAERRQKYADNPELRQDAIERSKKYQIENPDVVNAKSRLWYKNHPEKRRLAGQNRRNRMQDVEGELTYELIKEVYDESGGICAYCGRDCSSNWHLDHIIPIIRGGTNYRDNLAVACPPCNLSKGDKLLSEWIMPDYIADRDLSKYVTTGKPTVWNDAEYPSITAAARVLGISTGTLIERLDKGYVRDSDMMRPRKR